MLQLPLNLLEPRRPHTFFSLYGQRQHDCKIHVMDQTESGYGYVNTTTSTSSLWVHRTVILWYHRKSKDVTEEGRSKTQVIKYRSQE
ncbi:hypothetical protein ACF0H5_001340 [Mactra antiquata]